MNKEISYRVMKCSEFEDSIYYRVECGCGGDSHGITLEFEHDKEMPGMLFLNMYKKLAWSAYWHTDHWWEELWNRVKMSLKVLFKGYIEVEECFIIDGVEHIDSFIQALEEGKKKMKEKASASS